MSQSKIEWTGRSDWNPVRGCSRVSPGCGGPGPHGGCYAEAMAARFSKPGMWGHGFAEMQDGKPRWTGKVELQEDRLLMPLSWRKPGFVFPNSTSDFFHEALPDTAIDKLFAVMALCPHLTFQIPTKRAERMRDYMTHSNRPFAISNAINGITKMAFRTNPWPLANVWLGVSAERQQEFDERWPHLRDTPAAVRFISYEPALGPLNVAFATMCPGDQVLDWLICGGESGHGARPMNPQWARDVRDQCRSYGIAFFHKQNGEYVSVSEVEGEGAHFHFPDGRTVRRVGKKAAGRLLDGIEHNAMPDRVTA